MNDYVSVFSNFSKVKESDFEYKEVEGQHFFNWEDVTYQVMSRDDLRNEIISYVSAESYLEVFSQLPEQLWDVIWTNYAEVTPSDLIVSLYKEWETYWIYKREIIKDSNWYEKLKTDSYRELQMLIEAYKLEGEDLVNNASTINSIELIPLVVFAIKRCYEDDDAFYDDALEALTNYCGQFYTMGDTFEEMELKKGRKLSEFYYVFNPLLPFEELDSE